MKQYWQRIATKIDALTLRERVIIFAMAALLLIVLVNAVLLDPQYAKQKQLSQRIKQDRAQMAAMQAEIQQRILSQTVDPDAENKARLQQLRQQASQLRSDVDGQRKGLISSDKISLVLQDILRQNARLRLVSLKKLPPSSLNELALAGGKVAGAEQPERGSKGKAEAASASASEGKPIATQSVYRHGVEIVVQGGYLDLVDYLSQLEVSPWQLFWGRAKLEVGEYPRATLTLTLFTLSLDKEWLNI